jgi:hypothetical protein
VKVKIVLSSLVLSFVLLTVLAILALAVGRAGAFPEKSSSIVVAAGQPAELPVQVRNRLTEAKLRACQARESVINKRTTRLGELVTTIEGKFDTIAGRVEDYYSSKVVPSGSVVANYGALVADIQTKKAAVQAALSTAQTSFAGFHCDGDDPKGLLNQFRVDMQAVRKALQAYRMSIKNLIVAVRLVTSTTERTNSNVSPMPTK